MDQNEAGLIRAYISRWPTGSPKGSVIARAKLPTTAVISGSSSHAMCRPSGLRLAQYSNKVLHCTVLITTVDFSPAACPLIATQTQEVERQKHWSVGPCHYGHSKFVLLQCKCTLLAEYCGALSYHRSFSGGNSRLESLNHQNDGANRLHLWWSRASIFRGTLAKHSAAF